MSKVVQRSVAATNPETGETKWFHQGDEIDSEWAEFVTNPDVFKEYPADEGQLGAGDERAARSAGRPDLNSTEPGGADGETGEAGFDGMNKSDLEEACEQRGLAKSGTKPELIERLKAHDAANG